MTKQNKAIALAYPDTEHLGISGCYDIKSRYIAVGGSWIVDRESRSEQTFTSSAISMAEDHRSQFMMLRRRHKQYGLFSFRAEDGKSPTSLNAWHSGAALLSDQVQRSAWMGGFKLPDGRWWTVVVHHLKINPDGDQVHETEEEARAFLMEKRGQGTWLQIFAPKSWGIDPNSDGTPLEDLLTSSRLKWILLSVNRLYALRSSETRHSAALRLGVRFLMIAALVACIGAGVKVALDYKAKHDAQKIVTPVITIDQSPPVPGPAPNYLSGRTALFACLEAVHSHWPKDVLTWDWTPTGYSCDGRALVMTAGAQANIPLGLSKTSNPRLTVDGSGRAGSVTIQVTTAGAAADALPTDTEISLRHFFDAYVEGLPGSTWQGNRLPGPQGEQAQRVIPRFAAVKWHFDSSAPPIAWAPVFARMPDWSLDRLGYDDGKHLWTVEATSYVRP